AVDCEGVVCGRTPEVTGRIPWGGPGEIDTRINDPGHPVTIQLKAEGIAVGVVPAFATAQWAAVKGQMQVAIGAPQKYIACLPKNFESLLSWGITGPPSSVQPEIKVRVMTLNRVEADVGVVLRRIT